eukprot:6490756-Amphidinium_carterae.1
MLRAKKATPNVLAGEGWLRIYTEVADYLAAAINRCLEVGDLPNSWKGSVVVPVRKGTLTGLKCSSYRPIQLVTTERKTLGKLLLERISPEIDSDPAQFCIGASAGTALPVFALNQILAQARTENKSSAVLFLDIKAAYDCVIQELVLPSSPNDEGVVCALVKLGLDEQQARSSLAYIRAHPDALINSRLPPALKTILANWMKNSWSILAREWQRERQSYIPDDVYQDSRQGVSRILDLFHECAPFAPQTVQTNRGIKQGDSLSTWLFCALFKLVLSHGLEAFSRSGLQECSMPQWPVPSLKGDTTSAAKCHVRVDRLGYADDVAIPLMDHDASRLLRAVEALMRACHDSFRSFGFQLNYKRGKSALMLRLIGRDAKGLWQHVKHCSDSRLPLATDFEDFEALADSDLEGETVDLKLDETADSSTKDMCVFVEDDIPLQVCTQYIYLGSWFTSQMNLLKEVRVRRAAAIKSFNTHASILTSTALSIHQRLSLCKSLCVCHLLQQLHAFQSLTKKQLSMLESTYVSLLKRTCRLDLTTPEEWKSIGSEDVLRAIGEPSLMDILTARRLTFLQSVMSSGNPLIAACANLRPKDSVTTAWYSCLNHLRSRVPSLSGLPEANSGTFSTWLSFIIPAQTSWRSLLKRTLTQYVSTDVRKQHSLIVAHFRSASNGAALRDQFIPNPQFDHLVVDPDDNAQEQHGVDEPDVIELTCRHCDKVFGTRRGLASHMRTRHHIYPPLALRTYSTKCPACGVQMLTRNNLLQHLANRLVCGLHVLEHVEPMSADVYHARVHELDTERAVLSRDIVPRTGPIPIVNGKPCSQGVEAINPYHFTLSDGVDAMMEADTDGIYNRGP